MKTKILYVLVSSYNDIYLEQAFISIASVRHHMPNAHISMIIDNATKLSLNIHNRGKMLKEVNELICIDLPNHFTPQQKSRILKTSARKYISGNYIFIDCDTIVLSSLEEIDNWNFDMGACRDSHSDFINNPYRNMCVKDCKRLGFDISNELTYFNSGVLYVKDTPKTRAFYEKWNSNWLEGMKKGVNMDQPSFAITNIQLGREVHRLPDIWNCQMLHGLKYYKDAKIMHYLCTNKSALGDIFILRGRHLLEKVKENVDIPQEVIICFDDPFKGISETVQIFGGDIIKVFQSNLWVLIKSISNTKIFRIFDNISKGLINVKHSLKKHI